MAGQTANEVQGVKKRTGSRRYPVISKKQQKQRRAIVLELLSRMESLRAELQACTSVERRSQISAELGHLRRKQSRLSLAEKEPKVAPLPPSFVERIKADRKATARISGRDKIGARFVQGGAPGTGK
ncbi:hypothetical protein J4G48_0006140 [Bradyrhizobium barranii subsp. apii]|uniref:hypothetical protein n=1 Tax=Bradyrhizobium barranii TaxID=2992140 RepID=UPI001AA18B91|nr:hypothetical protein [Bradyrhizobium barranii]UPT97686.1 hypothetical protein J4G48_0006140 [Bradyrhizobium barranii subsp. apii]